MLFALLSQNLPSALAVHSLGPRPGENILDLCAAPGGKTTHIAALLKGTGRVVAVDRSPARLSKLNDLAKTLNLSAVIEPICADGTKLPTLLPKHLLFDRVLVDPPCSALGQRPRLYHGGTAKELGSQVEYQRRLLSVAVRLLKPGGKLVFSTCTINPAENEANVNWLLGQYDEMQLTKQEPRLGLGGVDGFGLSAAQRALVQRFDPADPRCAESIGFFIASFEKSATESPEAKPRKLRAFDEGERGRGLAVLPSPVKVTARSKCGIVVGDIDASPQHHNRVPRFGPDGSPCKSSPARRTFSMACPSPAAPMWG